MVDYVYGNMCEHFWDWITHGLGLGPGLAAFFNNSVSFSIIGS